MEMNKKDNESIYVYNLPASGKFIHTIVNGGGKLEYSVVEEEELRRLVGEQCNPNLKLEEMVEEYVKFYTEKGFITYESDVKCVEDILGMIENLTSAEKASARKEVL